VSGACRALCSRWATSPTRIKAMDTIIFDL
jgi:hypothetical protein